MNTLEQNLNQITNSNNYSIECGGILRNDLQTCAETGQEFQIYCTTCPPYNSEDGKFTFNGYLDRNSSGLVARSTLENLVPFALMCDRLGINSRLHMAYANQETFDPYILQTMDIAQEEFIRDTYNAMLQSIGSANTIFHKNNTGYRTVVEGIPMSPRLISETNLGEAEQIVNDMSIQELTNIAATRSDIYMRRFQAVYANQPGDFEFMQKVLFDLARVDIKEHIAFGRAMRQLKTQGEKVAIATMSIPHLTKYFNYCANPDGSDRVPVIRLTNNY